ncbi:Reticulon [Ancylostoma caninum]|uniref:Reticulon-like protein n=1 Tax=Ancylostoma caninum TaxID=29170 RepID=A0A368FWL1_ANCCA|nr:Reticulon [Ancylostoma caninum]
MATVMIKKQGEDVLELIYWRDPKKSAVALSLILLAVFILAKYPILSVFAYTGLAVLAGTLGFRVYKTVEAQVKKTSGENPFQEYLAKDLTLPQERIHAQVDVLTEHATHLANQVKRLIFVENIVDSAKVGVRCDVGSKALKYAAFSFNF